jgi:hypothetical protein
MGTKILDLICKEGVIITVTKCSIVAFSQQAQVGTHTGKQREHANYQNSRVCLPFDLDAECEQKCTEKHVFLGTEGVRIKYSDQI